MGLSTHVLDTALGLPAGGVEVGLERRSGERWLSLGTSVTDETGRSVPVAGEVLEHGQYRLRFATAAHFARQRVESFYPYVEVVFEVRDDRHYHVPLLLAANGFTTYRGS